MNLLILLLSQAPGTSLTSAPVLTLVGGVAVGVLGLVGVFRTAGVARAANARTAAIEEFRTALEARDRLLDRFTGDTDTLRKRLDDMDTALEEERGLRRRVEHSCADLMRWARVAARSMQEAGIPIPQPKPPGVLDTDPGQRKAERTL